MAVSRFNDPAEITHYSPAIAEWVTRPDSDECWPWNMSLDTQGYGLAHAHVNGVKRRGTAHRLVYLLRTGAITPGLTLDHLCRNRDCVNPAHLEAVTQLVNTLRGVGAKTHCRRGHELSDGNLIPSNLRHGYRACLTCHRELAAARRKT